MKRYFDLTDKNTVVEFDIADGSLASVAPVEDFEHAYKTKLREIDKNEYRKLKAQYGSS